MPSESSATPPTPFRFALPEALRQGQLPTTPAAFQGLLDMLSAQVDGYLGARFEQAVATAVTAKMRQLVEQLRLQRQRLFGARSEVQHRQGQLFNEAEQIADTPVADTPPASSVGSRKSAPRGHGGRHALPPTLPRVEVHIDSAADTRQCNECGGALVKIGEDVSERLNIVPMRIEVIRTIRPRYACPAGHAAPVVAPLPPTVLPRTQFDSGFLATLLTVKYVDGLPLYRFAKVLQRHGVTVSRQTLARTVVATARALQPLANLARDALLASPVLHMDETPVQVLKEPGRAPQSKSYMWVAKGGPPGRPVIVYDYAPTRSGQVPMRLLQGWAGYLMTDGYEGYAAVAGQPGVEHLVCMAHARRKFVEAQRVAPHGHSPRAAQALAFFGQLYGLERSVKDQDDAARWRARVYEGRPVLAQFRQWLAATRPQVAPRSKLGQALAYLDRYWPKLIRYVERGDLPIDNNACENAIRPFVVGRKAWLFSDTQAGATASALIYSLVETAKANALDPYLWLRHVLTRLPLATTVEALEALMPWNIHVDSLLTPADRA